MIRYAVLGSGSSGNSFLFSTDNESLLIDAGFSLASIKRRAKEANLKLDNLKGVCLTHLHPDHCRGAGVIARKMGVPIYLNHPIIEQNLYEFTALNIPKHLISSFTVAQNFNVGLFNIKPFAISHDFPHSVGFSIEIKNRVFTILTDTGYIEETVYDYLEASDVLFIEANYDEKMLKEGPYPPFLKRRIAGKEGHLSNCDAIKAINKCNIEKISRLYFCHLSKTNNNSKLLEETCLRDLKAEVTTTVCEHGSTYNGKIGAL